MLKMRIILKKLNTFIESFRFLKHKKGKKKPNTIWITSATPSETARKIIERQLAMSSTAYSKFKMEQMKYEMNSAYSIKDTIDMMNAESFQGENMMLASMLILNNTIKQ